MQVAIERGFEAHRASAEPDTLAAFDLAHEATEAAARLSPPEHFDGEESREAVEVTEYGLLMDLLMDGTARSVIHRHRPTRQTRETLLQRHFLAQADIA